MLDLVFCVFFCCEKEGLSEWFQLGGTEDPRELNRFSELSHGYCDSVVP